MSGTDLDIHALAADIRGLSKGVESLRQEGRERGDKLEKILMKMAQNSARTDGLSRRLSDLETERIPKMEKEIAALQKWRWQVVGALSLLLLILQFIFNQ